jgi:hypothetical protein
MKRLFTILIFASASASIALADPQTEVSPKELSWDTYDAVSSHASQAPQETLYFNIDWKNNVLDAQREAHQKDKPIVMILFFGDHRSNC